MNNLIPFSIEQYNTGNYDVVYRSGEVPDDWYYSEKTENLVSFNPNGTICHILDGCYLSRYQPSHLDLMLKPKERWIVFDLRMNDRGAIRVCCDAIEAKLFPHIYKIRINQTNHEECYIEPIND